MRIALTHPFCWPEVRRGAERFTQELGAGLARRGHEVTNFSAAWDTNATSGDLVTTVRLRRRFSDAYRHEADFAARLLPRLLRQRFDAVHSLGRWDAVASAVAARTRRDHRTTVMTDLGLPDRAWWRSQGRAQAWAAARAVAWVDVYSGMSRAAVEALAASYGRRDGVVVPGGVHLDRFSPAARRTPHPTILFSGAIEEPRKGVPVLLAALPAIARDEPDVEVWLSGPGDPARWLEGLAEDVRRRVRHLGVGEPEAQPERYGRAWVTCLPSMHDSFGMALIESLACGTPLVTTTHGAPPELVSVGVTGEVCAPEDPPALAAACLRAFRLSRDPGTIAACRASAERFDWDRALAPLCEGLYAGPR